MDYPRVPLPAHERTFERLWYWLTEFEECGFTDLPALQRKFSVAVRDELVDRIVGVALPGNNAYAHDQALSLAHVLEALQSVDMHDQYEGFNRAVAWLLETYPDPASAYPQFASKPSLYRSL